MRRLLLPTLSGVLYFLSWIGFGIWPLAFVCFVPLLWSLRDATPRRALWLGAWMGFVAHLGGSLILSALQAVVNGALFDALEAWRSGKAAPVGAMMASLISLLGSATYGYVRLVRVEHVERTAPKVPIGLAQPNVGELEL